MPEISLEKALRSPNAEKKVMKAAELSHEEKEERREKMRQEIKTRGEQFKRETLMQETATFSNADKRQIGIHKHASRTSAGDSLQHGPRGGRFASGIGLKRLR